MAHGNGIPLMRNSTYNNSLDYLSTYNSVFVAVIISSLHFQDKISLMHYARQFSNCIIKIVLLPLITVILRPKPNCNSGKSLLKYLVLWPIR